MNELAPASTTGLVPQNLDQAVRLAEIMANSKLVPQHLQKQPADCLLVIEQAMRWRMSPFAVAQCTSVIKGRLMFEGKLVAAVAETCGAITGHFEYTFEGSGDNRSITVSGILAGDKTARSVTVRLKDARTSNEQWVKQPDQQLVYHGARVWTRRWAPAVMLGVYSREEFPANPDAATFDGVAIEGAAEEEAPPAPPEPAPQPPRPKLGDWLRAVESDLGEAAAPAAVELIVSRPDVAKALASLQGEALARLSGAIHAARERVMPFPGDVTEGEESP